MNVFIFTIDMPPFSYGGVATYVDQLSRSLVKKKLNVTIIHYLSDKIEKKEIINNNGLTIIKIPSMNNINLNDSEKMKLYGNYVIEQIKEFIIKDKKYLFHLNCWTSYLLVDALKNNYNHPIIFTLHSLEWQFSTNGNIHMLDRLLNDKQYLAIKQRILFEKETIQLSDKVIAVSHSIAKLLKESYNTEIKKIDVVYNGIDKKQLESMALTGDDALEFKRKIGFNDNERIIVFSGRLYDQKGVKYLIRAFRELSKKYDDIRLLIIGSGNFVEVLERCKDIWAKIIFTGFVQFPDVVKLYSIADIGVVPSIFEPFGYVAIEMMSLGLPIVVSKIDGLSEIITDQYDGINIDIQHNELNDRYIDVDELVSRIDQLLQNVELRYKISLNAKNTVKRRFTVDVMAKKTYDIYSKCLSLNNYK